MRLILVRHGETEYNKTGRLMGHMDISLNKVGKQQAQKIAQRIANEKIDYIYSSDLKRCLETLEEIKRIIQNIPTYIDQQLRERDVGIFEGQSKEEVKWDDLPGTFLSRKPSGGESLSDMKARLNRFLKHLKDRHVGETVLLVTHGGVIRIIHHLMTRESLEESFKKFKFQHTALTVYDLTQRKPQVIMFNDASHL